MTQPQYGYPPQQASQYPPAQGYPAPAPAYSQPAPQGYAPQPQYGYPPAPAPGYGYPPQAAPQQPPAQPLAQGSLDDFYNQPSSGGGVNLKFTDANNLPMIGKRYVFRVARPIGKGDVQQQTDKQNNPLTWRDGSPKFVMIVPGQLVEPDPAYADGVVKWYCKGMARDELSRAMAEAGAPEGAPEHNAVIAVTLQGVKPSGPGMNASHQFAIQYWRPQGAAPVGQGVVPQPEPQQVAAPTANYQPAPTTYAPPAGQAPAPQYAEHAAAPQGYAPQPAYAPQGPGQAPAQAPTYQAAPNYQPAPATAPQAHGMPPQQPQSAPVQNQQPVQQPLPMQLPTPDQMTPEQQQLLQRMVGQNQAPAQQ